MDNLVEAQHEEQGGWNAMLTRHRAALDVVRSGAELDRELLLSYVVWPTAWIEDVVHEALEPAVAA